MRKDIEYNKGTVCKKGVFRMAFLYVVYFLIPLFLVSGSNSFAAEQATVPPKQNWSWTGFKGKFDKKQLKRGLQVYTEVCSGCHSLNLLYYRNLLALGYSMDEIKEYASEYEVQDGPNDEGEMFTRPARPSDRFVAPFANEKAARVANNGALPPDLSLIIKSRANGKGNILQNFWNSVFLGFGAGSGADYVHALITHGYSDPPEDFTLGEGMYYNTYFAGRQIAMPPPIYDDVVEYDDGTVATKEQVGRDIVAFLSWVSEPELEYRKAMGLRVMIFLGIFWFIVLLYKRRVWANVKKT